MVPVLSLIENVGIHHAAPNVRLGICNVRNNPSSMISQAGRAHRLALVSFDKIVIEPIIASISQGITDRNRVLSAVHVTVTG